MERNLLVALTWDLEIAKPVESLPNKWKDARAGLAGISSVVIYDPRTGRPHIYGEDTLDACAEHLNSADILVGWNNTEFDRPCFEGATGFILKAQDWDILKTVHDAVGFQKGWRLGETSERTIGKNKSGTGEHAPTLAQAGRWHELIDYNINDVHLTRLLANHILANEYLIDPSGEHVPIKAPRGVQIV